MGHFTEIPSTLIKIDLGIALKVAKKMNLNTLEAKLYIDSHNQKVEKGISTRQKGKKYGEFLQACIVTMAKKEMFKSFGKRPKTKKEKDGSVLLTIDL